MGVSIPPLPQYAFMAWYSVTKESTGTALPLPLLGGKDLLTSECGRFTPGEEPPVSVGWEAGWDPEPAWMRGWGGGENYVVSAGNRTSL
jgi:hypothetical protein